MTPPGLSMSSDVAAAMPGGIPLSFLESWPDPVLAVRQERVVIANRSVASYLGYGSPGELVGRQLLDLIHPEDRALTIERMRNALERGNANPALHRRFLRRDGTVVEAEAASIAVGRGEQAILMIVIRDLTQRKRLEQQLAVSDKAAALTGLAGSIALEINNPVGYLLTNLEYALEEIHRVRLRLNEVRGAEFGSEALRLQDAADAIDDAASGGRRIARVVRSLRELSGEVAGDRRPLDLKSVAEAALDLVATDLRQKANLIVELGASPQVLGSEQQLMHVLISLLGQARASVQRLGGSGHEIRLSSGTDAQGWAFVEVRDSGVTLPPEVREHLFDLFSTGAPPATDLALPIAASIVRDHGGEVIVRPNPPSGSILRLIFPPVGGVAPPKPSAPAPRLRLLVIDDEVGYLVSLQRLLGKVYEVTIANRAVEAMDRLEAGERFDLVLCDMVMPEMNGMQFAAALESAALPAKPPVLFVTGGVFTVEAREFLRQPGVLHLTKPFTRQQLQEVIDIHVNRPEVAK